METVERAADNETLDLNPTLLHDFTRGDPDAFEALFRRYQTQVHGWITRIVRDPVIAEDLTVETFWRIHRAHARFDPQRSFAAWSRRIATNVALDHLKTRRIELQIEMPESVPQNLTPDQAIQSQIRQTIDAAFLSLPAKLQIAATLALIEERPYQEVADALGISLTAVKSRIFRAVRILRKKLEHQGIEP